MPGRTTKGTAIGASAALISIGVQQALVGGEPYLGLGAILIGGVLAIVYQFAEESDHGSEADALVESIGDDTLRELANMTGEELRQLKAQLEERD